MSANMLHLPESRLSTRKSCVAFKNRTSRKVDIVWVDYKGKLVKYMTFGPGLCFNCDTYITHPWIAFDSVTFDQLLLDSSYVYYPTETDDPARQIPHTRKTVNITEPLISLRQRAMQVARNSLSGNFGKVSDLIELGLPTTVANELVYLLELIHYKTLGYAHFSCENLYYRKILNI